jgi:hypothetical protein
VGYIAEVSCTSSTACTAVGSGFYDGALAERWDGSRWSPQTVGDSSGALTSVSCSTATRCTAVGQGDGLIAAQWSGVGTAKLIGVHAGCVRKLVPRIKGTGISSVMWSVDHTHLRGRVVRDGTTFTTSVSLSPGSHRFTVKVTFASATDTKARTFHRTVIGCPLAPVVTG